jgi:hypothetical protein
MPDGTRLKPGRPSESPSFIMPASGAGVRLRLGAGAHRDQLVSGSWAAPFWEAGAAPRVRSSRQPVTGTEQRLLGGCHRSWRKMGGCGCWSWRIMPGRPDRRGPARRRFRGRRGLRRRGGPGERGVDRLGRNRAGPGPARGARRRVCRRLVRGSPGRLPNCVTPARFGRRNSAGI